MTIPFLLAGAFVQSVLHIVPFWLRHRVNTFFSKSGHAVRNFLNAFVPGVSILEGGEKKSGLPLVMACVGVSEEDQQYWIAMMFGSPVRRRSFGRCLFFNVSSLIHSSAPECHFVLTAHNSITRCLSSKAEFYIPQWIDIELDVGDSWMKVFSRESDVCRKVQGSGLTCEIARNMEDFDDFYDNMYVPYMQEHYKGAQVEAYADLLEIFTRGELLLIMDAAGNAVGGRLFEVVEGKAFCRPCGVRYGDRQHMNNDVIDVGFYFLLDEMKKRGCRKLHLGPARPFLNDRETRFKISLKTQLAFHQNHPALAMTLLRESPALKTFFVNHPFVGFEEAKRRYRAVFFSLEDASDEEFNALVQDSVCHGLAETHLFVFGPVEPRANYFFAVHPAGAVFEHVIPLVSRKPVKVSAVRKFLRRFSLAGRMA